MKKYILPCMMILMPFLVKAQQDPMISQYMFTGLVLNPAYAGSHEFTNATALYRYQWANVSTDNGTDGWNPRTFVATVDGKIQSSNLAWGVILGNDQYGPSSKNDVIANFGYHLPVGNGKLSVGLRGGMSFYNADLNTLNNLSNDPAFQTNASNAVLGNFGAGVYYYSKKFYAGVSVPHVVENTLVTDNSTYERHYYATTGYVLEVSDNLAIKPSILMKAVNAAPVEFDFNLNFLISNMVWLGASYRTGDSYVFLVEYQATKNLRIGYAYDKLFTDLDTYSTGSHEFMISYDFGVSPLKVRSPRYF